MIGTTVSTVRRTRPITRIEAVLILLVAVLVPSDCRASESPSMKAAQKAATEALLGIQILSESNVAETLGIQIDASARGPVVLSTEPPLKVFEIEMSDLRHSEAWPLIKKAGREEQQKLEEELEKLRKDEKWEEYDRKRAGYKKGSYDKYFKDAKSLSEALSRMPKKERGEAAEFFAFMEVIFGGNRERVLEKLKVQNPKQLVFQAFAEGDGDRRQVTPVVVRRYPDPENEGWRLFKVGQAPLAETLQSNPDALYILQVPALYLSFVAKPPVGDRCKPSSGEEPAARDDGPDCLCQDPTADTTDRLPSGDDCLAAIYEFPDLYGVKAGDRGFLSGWLTALEVIAKTWQGSPERSVLLWQRKGSGR